MIYKKPVELDDLIAYANIMECEGVAVIKGHKLIKSFRAQFWLRDFGKTWLIFLFIEVENEVPRLIKATTYGRGGIPLAIIEKFGGRGGSFTAREKEILNNPELQEVREPVKAKHLTLLARHSYELITKATVMSMQRYASLEHYRKTGEQTGKKFYSGKELQNLEKELAKTARRNAPTDSMLKDVAKRYKKAEKAGDPLYDDIMRHYSLSERRARELITMCRRHKDKLLPKRKAGRPSVNPTPTRKKGK